MFPLQQPGTSPNPEKKRVSILVADAIAGKIRLVNPFFVCQSQLGMQGQVFNGLENTQNAVSLPTGSEEVWLTQRTDLLNAEVVKVARERGTRIVHDIDDMIWNIPSHNPNAKFPRVTLESLKEFLHAIDCVTVSTEPLQEALANIGIESLLVPNGLSRKDWTSLQPMRRSGCRPRVGWAGQQGVHQADLALVHDVMEQLTEEVEWVFLGDAPGFSRNSQALFQVFPMVSIEQFPQALANLNLDLAIAPLTINEFNEGKSDLRILQYGVLGYPVLATDIFPHRHAPVRRVSNDPGAWVRAIREYIHDLDAAEEEGKKLRQWVLNRRMTDHLLPQYRNAWLGLSTSPVLAPPSCSPASTGEVISGRQQPHAQDTFDCSIIIPVNHQCDVIRQCLVALAEVTKGCSYEVILLDNGSDDETSKFLRTLGGDVKVIRNDENREFLKCCNQGAVVARGRYLVFLDDRLIPMEGWLSALVQEVQQHQDVAIVSSKLVDADNAIQHCGVAFSPHNCEPYHLYKGKPENDPTVNARGEREAVTAACMLIRREMFESVGGFNEGDLNGFEDIDLCLTVKEQGGKIIYQPNSVLRQVESRHIHDEDCERKNWQRLFEKWKAKLVVDEDLMSSVSQ